MPVATNAPFDPSLVPCTCEGEPNPSCLCAQAGGAEKVLRYVMSVEGKLSPAQREWCLSEIDGVEGFKRADYDGASDADVARGTIDAWLDYCRDKGIL